MNKNAYHIVRVGIAITFLWIGILILQNPELWSGYIQPWVRDLLPLPAVTIMIATAIFDLIVGFFLLVDFWTWIFSLLAAGHIAMVLAVSGIDVVTVRDIGLLAASVAIFVDAPHPVFRLGNTALGNKKKSVKLS
jgi:uncharacterized membrane protein